MSTAEPNGILLHRIRDLIIATGVSSVATQLLTIREFLSQFNGNEFVAALILFNWLFLGGAGTWLARLSEKKATIRGLFWISLALAAMPPVMLLTIRKSMDVIFIHGRAVGFYPTLFHTLLSIAPYCLLAGFALPYTLAVLQKKRPDYPGTRVYILDNLGDIAGGMIFSFVLVFLTTPLQAVFITQIPLLWSAWRLYGFFPGKRAGVFGIAAVLAVLSAGLFLERSSLAPGTGTLMDYRETPYGRLEVIQDADQTSLFQNGRPAFFTQNSMSAEEAAHFPLSQLGRVNRVLMISAEAQMMEEVLKHQPRAIDYLEIDPQVMAAQYQFGLLRHHPAVQEINEDARAFLRKTVHQYDAILIHLPEPDTFQINRFYTREFFALCRAHLSPEGVVSFSIQGFDAYASAVELEKISMLFRTAREVFPFVQMLPGNRLWFLCRDQSIDKDIPKLLNQKHVPTAYISGYYAWDVPEAKIQRLEAQLDPDAPVNRDFSPHLVRVLLTEWFSLFKTSPLGFLLVFSLLNLVYLFTIRREEWVLYTTGWCAMGTEVLVLFAFQIFFGYMYLKIGWVITVFLAGLLPGAALGERTKTLGKRVIMAADALLMALIGFFAAMVRFSAQPPSEFGFLMFGFLVSLVCGFQFPLALHLRGDENSGKARAFSGSFSADLMGAAFGTMITSVVLIPYTGILFSAVSLMLLKSTSLVLMAQKK